MPCTASSIYTTLFAYHEPPTTNISTLSLHDALPISLAQSAEHGLPPLAALDWPRDPIWQKILHQLLEDRKSTRLNSSHVAISYAVFCLKKKRSNVDMKAPDMDTTLAKEPGQLLLNTT